MKIIEDLKNRLGSIDVEKRIKYLKLSGIIFSSLVSALSLYYLITELSCWVIYSPFVLFGLVLVYLFGRKEKSETLEVYEKKNKKEAVKKIVPKEKAALLNINEKKAKEAPPNIKEKRAKERLLKKIEEKQREKELNF